MRNGELRIANGEWRIANGRRTVAHHLPPQFAIRHSLFNPRGSHASTCPFTELFLPGFPSRLNHYDVRIDPDHRHVKTVTHAVEDLAANADIAARAIHSFNKEAWIVAARVVNQASAASGIDDSNTCVVAVAQTAGAVASETFDSTTAFPAANTAHDLGTISNPCAAAGAVLTLAVTNGTTADPGPFLVEVDYV